MEIDRLSASSMDVLEKCPSRFKANQLAGRGAEISGYAAMIGTTCHYGAEHYVQNCIMQPKYSADWGSFEVFLMHGYSITFGNTDFNSAAYKECVELMKRWFARMEGEWHKFKVLSTEEKKFFMVDTSQGDRKFNYIFDRFDQIEETEYRVVDYKTLGRPLSPLDLHDKIQARVYGLAAQIMYPNATRIWVQFDMLRWEGPIGTVFNRQDNIDTWRRVKRAFEIGYAIPDGTINPKTNEPEYPPEQLNEECGFCIKKSTCSAVARNAAAGGVHTYSTLEEMVNARALLQMQAKAAKDAVTELDKNLLAHAEAKGLTQIDSDLIEGKIVMRPTRKVDAQAAMAVVGRDMFLKYGGEDGAPTIKLSDYDALLKDPALPADQRAALENLITREYGDPYFSTKPKKLPRK